MAPVEWYYAQDDKQIGPVSASEMKRLADAGILKPDDLVWREGMGEWIPASNVKGLFDEEIPVPPKSVPAPPKVSPPGDEPTAAVRQPEKPAFERSAARFERSREGASRHLFDFLLDFARSQFTAHFVESTSTMFTVCGHWGLYLAMLVLLAFHLLLALKTDSLNAMFLGIVGVFALAVLQYAASRFSGALDRLNRTTPGRIASTAFPDCCALGNMVLGLVALLGLAVVAIQWNRFPLILPGVGLFILCQYVAIVALNPDTINLSLASDVGAGEEAIGLLSFLVKVTLRVVPVAFGVGVVWGTLILLYAHFLLLSHPEGIEEIRAFITPEQIAELPTGPDPAATEQLVAMLPARQAATEAETILLLSGALPLVAYMVFLVYYLLVDVLRAILIIPQKLDKPAEEEAGRINDE